LIILALLVYPAQPEGVGQVVVTLIHETRYAI